MESLQKRIGIVPDKVLSAMAAIGRGDDDESLHATIAEWVNGDGLRENFVRAWLEPDQDDSGSYHTKPLSPTDKGTGLARQGKMPRDSRYSDEE